MSAVWDAVATPIGELTLTAGERGLTGIRFPPGGRRDPAARSAEALAPARDQLAAYFARDLRRFDLELDLRGGALELAVWERLLATPYGETLTYGELARDVGRPDIVRGVAAMVGRTPIPIVIPCHRVIGAGGALTGYGGGLDRKRALLRLEAGGSPELVSEPASRQLSLL
jgi:methylated-DNA-[protein]-cysteine S-methyltransferase